MQLHTLEPMVSGSTYTSICRKFISAAARLPRHHSRNPAPTPRHTRTLNLFPTPIRTHIPIPIPLSVPLPLPLPSTLYPYPYTPYPCPYTYPYSLPVPLRYPYPYHSTCLGIAQPERAPHEMRPQIEHQPGHITHLLEPPVQLPG